MNPNAPERWQTLFDELPVDTTVDNEQMQSLKQQVLQSYDKPIETVWWRNQLSRTGRYLMTNQTPRWAATAAALFLVIWFLSVNNRSTFAMDELLDTILNARTVRFVTTARAKGLPPIEILGFYAEPAKMRQEIGDGQVMIYDFELGKALILNKQAKTAMVLNMTHITDEVKKRHQENGFTTLRTQILEAQKNPGANIQPVGEKEIDGRKLVGFRFRVPPFPMTIWADSETHQPYLIESKSAGPPETEITMSKFEFDVELDDALFSVEVPEGYRRADQALDLSKPTEDDLIRSLLMYSEVSGGKFPDSLSAATSTVEYMKAVGMDKVVGKDGQPDQKVMENALKYGRGTQFAVLLPAEAKAHYAGKDISRDNDARPGFGISRGEDVQPVFWYWEKDMQTWRVLGVDLEFRDLKSAPEIEGALPLLPP